MADRTVTVRLRALVSDFRRQMGQAGKDVEDVRGKVTKFAENHQQLGRAAALGGAAVVAGLGAAGMAANDYQKELDKMVGLVGVSRKQTEEWSQQLIKLGPEVGKSPKELAKAMFFVTSAGFEGAEAMDVLEKSAKASAAGLGETETVADAVTSAVNAYGKEALSAGDATDVLTATVREGKLEASELAPQLGQLLPIASELGIEFHEVGGTLATLSRTGLDAGKSATALKAIMSKLIKPSQQGKDTLADFGLTAQDVAQQVSEKGLIPTLRMLRETFGDNSEAMGKVFEDVEGLSGVLNLLGQDADTVDGIMSGVADSAGATEKAFEETQKGIEQFKAGLEAMVLIIGQEVAPMMRTAGELVGNLAVKFAELPAPVRKIAVLFTGATGVGALIAGGLILAIPRIAQTAEALKGLGVTTTAVKGKVSSFASFMAGPWGVALAAAAGGLVYFANRQADVSAESDRLAAEIGEVEASMADLSDQMLVNRLADRDVITTLRDMGLTLDDVRTAVAGTEGEFAALRARIDGSGQSMNIVQGFFDEFGDTTVGLAQTAIPGLTNSQRDLLVTLESLRGGYQKHNSQVAASSKVMAASSLDAKELDRRLGPLSGVIDASGKAAVSAGDDIEDFGEQTGEATEEVNALSDALKKQTAPVFAVMEAIQSARSAQKDYTEAVKEYGPASQEAEEAALSHAQAVASLEAEVVRGDLSFGEFQSRLESWVEQGRITQAEAKIIEERLAEVRSEGEKVQQLHPLQVDTSAPGAGTTHQQLSDVNRIGRLVPDFIDVDTSAPGAGPTHQQVGKVNRIARLVPDHITVDTSAPGATKATSQLQDLANVIGGIPGVVSVDVSGQFGQGDGPGFAVPPAAGGSAAALAKAAMAATPGRQYITSTYRSPAHNARVGGSPTSYHMDRNNPAHDIGGENLGLVYAVLQRMGGYRELLGPPNDPVGHGDHVHVAHGGGEVTRSGIRPLRSGELDARLAVGETVLTRSQLQSMQTPTAVAPQRPAPMMSDRQVDRLADRIGRAVSTGGDGGEMARQFARELTRHQRAA